MCAKILIILKQLTFLQAWDNNSWFPFLWKRGKGTFLVKIWHSPSVVCSMYSLKSIDNHLLYDSCSCWTTKPAFSFKCCFCAFEWLLAAFLKFFFPCFSFCVCVCVCMHVYTHTHTYIHIHARARTHIYIHIHTHTHTYHCKIRLIPFASPVFFWLLELSLRGMDLVITFFMCFDSVPFFVSCASNGVWVTFSGISEGFSTYSYDR